MSLTTQYTLFSACMSPLFTEKTALASSRLVFLVFFQACCAHMQGTSILPLSCCGFPRWRHCEWNLFVILDRICQPTRLSQECSQRYIPSSLDHIPMPIMFLLFVFLASPTNSNRVYCICMRVCVFEHKIVFIGTPLVSLIGDSVASWALR